MELGHRGRLLPGVGEGNIETVLESTVSQERLLSHRSRTRAPPPGPGPDPAKPGP